MAPSVRLSQRLLSKVQPSVWHFQPPGGMDGGLGTFEMTILTARFLGMNSIWSARFIEYDFHLVQSLCMLGLDKRLSVPGASGYTNFPIQHLSFLFSPSLQGSNFKQSKKYSSFPQAHISSYPQSITHFQHLHQFEIVWSRIQQSLFQPPLKRRPSAVQLMSPVRI